MNVTLYVGDRLVDLERNVRVTMNIQGYNFTNPATRIVSYSNTFSAPFTENNIVTFGYANDIHSNTAKPYRNLSCRYLIHGMQVFKQGVLIVTSSEDSFKLNIYEAEKEIFDTIKSKKLYELNYISGGPFNASAIDGYRTATTGVISPVIDWGQALGLVGSPVVNINSDYYLPSFFYHEIVKKSLEFTGLELSGDILTDTDFTDLIVPFSLDKWQYPDVMTKLFSFYAKSTFSTVTSATLKIFVTSEITGCQYYNTNLSQFEMPVYGATGNYFTYNFQASFNLQAAGSIGNSFYTRIVLFRSGVETTLAQNLQTMGSTGLIVDIELSASVNLRDSDVVYLKYYTNVGSPTVTITNVVFQGTNTGRIFDNWVLFSYLLPDMTMGDIVQDFTNRFGVIYRQVNDKLILKTLQDVISNKQNALDWTGKRIKEIDSIEFQPDYAQSNSFEYSSSLDDDKELGFGYIEIDNEVLDAEKTIYKSPFGNTKAISLAHINTAEIPVFEAQESVVFNQINNSGGRIQVQINGVDVADEYVAGTVFKVRSNNLVYNNVYAEVITSSFSTNTLVTIDAAYVSAAPGGTITKVDRSALNKAPGLRLLTLRSKLSVEEPVIFISGTSRTDYKVAFFNDIDYSTKTTGFTYFISKFYIDLSKALQRYKYVTRLYNLTQAELNSYNNHKIIYDSGDYFLVRRVPNFTPELPARVEQLLIKPKMSKG